MAQLQAVLFLCSMNAVRSPMAEGLAKRRYGRQVYIDSAGVTKMERDRFALSVLAELDIDFEADEAHTLDEIDLEGFDLIIALSSEAYEVAKARLRATAAELIFWPIADVTEQNGTRDQRMSAYRAVRDDLDRRIQVELGERLNGG